MCSVNRVCHTLPVCNVVSVSVSVYACVFGVLCVPPLSIVVFAVVVIAGGQHLIIISSSSSTSSSSRVAAAAAAASAAHTAVLFAQTIRSPAVVVVSSFARPPFGLPSPPRLAAN